MHVIFRALLLIAILNGAPVVEAQPVAITLHFNPDGIRATYVIAEPIIGLDLDGEAGDIRVDSWRSGSPGVVLSATGVAADVPIQRFDILVSPDTRQRDRIYPSLTPIGDGWLIFGPYLKPQGDKQHISISADLPQGWIAAGRRDASGALMWDGWIYAGPVEYVSTDAAGIGIVAPPAMPSWLKSEVFESANGAAGFYERRLGVKLPFTPTIVMSHHPEAQGVLRGDTTDGAMMSVRFFGAQWAERVDAAAVAVAEFLAHEVFHFWNGELAESAENSERPWVHEGGATYAALLAARKRGVMDERAFLAAMNRHLSRCQTALSGDKDLETQGPKGGQAAYSCGALLQWTLDIGVRQASSDRLDVLSVWASVFAESLAGERFYTTDSLLRASGANATKAAEVLLRSTGPTRWADLTAAANAYGAEMRWDRSAEVDRSQAILHLLNQYCEPDKPRGFATYPGDRIVLDAQAHCGQMYAPKADVDAIAGFHVIHQPTALNDRVREICAADGVVTFSFKGQPVLAPQCKAPMPPSSPVLQIIEDRQH